MRNIIKKLTVLGLCFVMVLMTGCMGQNGNNSGTEKERQQLIVLAAASLTDAMEELKGSFEAKNTDVELVITYGGSGALAGQIDSGAPADIFFAAAEKPMNDLVKKGLVSDGNAINVIENKMVLITPVDQENIQSFQDLAKPEITKIGIGDPESVPAGAYAREIFDFLKLTEVLQPKEVIASDVRQVLSWVETGNVEAGVVYETDAKTTEKVRIVESAPDNSHKKIVYPLGILKDSARQEQAKRYITFLTSEEAKTVFIKYGFTPIVK